MTVLVASALGALAVRADADCNRSCTVADQDSRGCCKAPSPPPTPPPLTISGDYIAKAPIVASKIVLANGAHVRCAPGVRLDMRATTSLTISGNVTIDCDGAAGSAGGAGKSWGPWCVGDDHSNASNDYEAGGNEQGGNGGNGGNGGDAEDVSIVAGAFIFDAGALLAIHAQGGAGGAGGAAGHGRHKSLARSGADCDHGTNIMRQAQAPDGQAGNPGNPGRGGKVTAKGRTRGTPKVELLAASSDVPLAWKPASPAKH